MKAKNFLSAVLCAAAILLTGRSVSAAESKATGFATLTLDDKGKLKLDLPYSIMGRDILLCNAVDRTCNGGDGVSGFISPESLLINFAVSDSLVIINEVIPGRFAVKEKNAREALRKSHTGAVIAKFEMDTTARDSSFVRIDVTDFFSRYDERLSPIDPYGADSFDGLISTTLIKTDNLSSIESVEGSGNCLSVISLETFSASRSFLGLSAEDGESFTVLSRKSLLLLDEEPMRGRIADPRIGVMTSPVTVFGSDDRGSKKCYYTKRRRIHEGDSLVFYIDTLFGSRMADAITRGVLKWNDAFEEMGYGKVLSVRPYPAGDSTFNANDLRFSCIKYEPSTNMKVRTSLWSDPRSGEIIASNIYVPVDVLKSYHTRMLFHIGHSEPSIRNISNEAGILYEALQADITQEIGRCLGLDYNYAGSYSVPLDSLHSVSFTNTVGLSGSIMDELPFNWAATPEEAAAGVRLVQTELGHYDKYAVKWIYADIKDAETPEDEVAALSEMIKKSSEDPYCLYIRRASNRMDPRYSIDPRVKADDLGDNVLEGFKVMKATFKNNIPQIDSWIKDDVTYDFRRYLNTVFLYDLAFAYSDLLRCVGGFYIEEKFEGDEKDTFTPVAPEFQREILDYVLEEVQDMSWIDNDGIYRDMFFVRSMADYTADLVVEDIMKVPGRLAFAQTKYDTPFTVSDALDMICDSITADAKAGKKNTLVNRRAHYVLVGAAMQGAGVSSLKNIADGEEISGFAPMAGLDFYAPEVLDHRFYKALVELRKTYARAARVAPSSKDKDEYEYLVMAIDRYLGEDKK